MAMKGASLIGRDDRPDFPALRAFIRDGREKPPYVPHVARRYVYRPHTHWRTNEEYLRGQWITEVQHSGMA